MFQIKFSCFDDLSAFKHHLMESLLNIGPSSWRGGYESETYRYLVTSVLVILSTPSAHSLVQLTTLCSCRQIVKYVIHNRFWKNYENFI